MAANSEEELIKRDKKHYPFAPKIKSIKLLRKIKKGKKDE
jgi:hypothetical protein